MFTLTKQPQDVDNPGQAGGEATASQGAALSDIVITAEMIAAGAHRLVELDGCAGPTYVAEQVFLAMAKKIEGGRQPVTSFHLKHGPGC
jgi:hypothetical protein